MNTLHLKSLQCFVIATVKAPDGSVLVELTCQLPGGRPCHRVTPYNRLRRGNEVDGAPPMQTAAEFEAWLRATYEVQP